MPRLTRILLLMLLAPMVLHARGGGQEGNTDRVRFGGDVRVDSGEGVGSAVAIGGSLNVDGILHGDAVAIGGSVTLGPHAVVKGDAVAIGGSIIQEPGAEVRGDRTEMIPPWSRQERPRNHWRSWPGSHWPFSLLSFLGFLAVALIMALALPEVLLGLSGRVAQAPGRCFLWGLLGTFALPLTAVLLAISLMGILLLPFLFLGAWLAYLIGYIAVAHRVGRLLPQSSRGSKGPLAWQTVAGVATLWLGGWIPFLGWLIKAVVSLLGFGAVLSMVWEKRGRAFPEGGPSRA